MRTSPRDIRALIQDSNLEREEILLILAMRKKFMYGEIIVIVHDGKPRRIKRAFETQELEHGLNDLTDLMS